MTIPEEILSLLSKYSYYYLCIIFLSLITIIIINFNKIKKEFIRIDKKTWIILSAIFFLGLFVRLFVFPHFHYMYMDEPAYIEMGKNMNRMHEPVICNYSFSGDEYCWNSLTSKGIAWPFLISLLFIFTGVSNYAVLYLNSFIGSLSIILIFLFSYLIFKNKNISLIASFLYAFTPLNIFWSNTAETNTVSVFFILFTLSLFLIYLEIKHKSLLLVSLLSIAFTFFIRYDNFIIIFLLLLLYFFDYRKNNHNGVLQHIDFFFPFLILLSISVIVIIESIFFYMSGDIFSYNLYFLNFFFILKDSSLNYFYLFLAAILSFYHKKDDKNYLTFLFISLLLFLIMYSEVYVQSRFSLTPILFFIILSAYSLYTLIMLFQKYFMYSAYLLAAIVITLLLVLNYNFYNDFTNNSFFALNNLETSSVNRVSLEVNESCYIITEMPVVLGSVSNHKIISSYSFINDGTAFKSNNSNCVYYFYDSNCLSGTVFSRLRCKFILDNFNHTVVSEYTNRFGNYYLYRLY